MPVPSFRGLCLFVGAFLAASLISACDDSPERSAAQFVGRAEQQLAAGDTNAAVIELKNAIQHEPGNGRARLLLGQIYLAAGDGASAEKELAKAQAAGVSGIELELPLARSRLIVGSYQSVLDQVPIDLSLDSTAARELYVARGEALMALQRVDEAVTAFERVLAGENIARAHGGLARIAIFRREFEQADQHLKEALTLEPERSEWLALKGESLLSRGRYEEAKAAFAQFVDKDKAYAEGQIGYVRALVGVGELEKAHARVEDLQRLAPNDPRLVLLSGMIDLERGDFLSAKDSAERILGRDDANERALYVAGVASYRLGQYELANKRLTQYSLSGNDKDARALLYLGATKLRLGDTKGALAVLQSNPALVQQSAAALDLLAQATVQSGDIKTGLEYLEQLAERRPQDAETQARLGLVRVAAGEEDAGIEALEKAVEQDPQLDAVAQQLILEQIRAGKLDEALAGAQRLTEKHPDRAAGYILQGVVLLQKGTPGEAEKYFRKAWEVEPGSASAGLNLAQIELSSGNKEAAIVVLNQVVERNPGHVQALLFLADLEGRSGNPDRQEKLLRDALEANADSGQARVLLARLLVQRNRASEALTVLRPALTPDLAPSNVNGALLETAAIASIMQNDPSQALGYLKQLQNLQPNSVQAQFLSAQAHIALGELALAEEALHRALAINSDHYDSRRFLAEVLQRSGRYEESLEQLAIAEKLRPTDPSLADMEARAHLAARRSPQAIAAAQRALELAPRTERAIALAQAYWAGGQKTEAITSLDGWLKAKPDDGAIHLALASMLFQDNQMELALQHYGTASTLQPNSAVVANDFAWALWRSGNKEQALKQAERALELAPNDPRVKDTAGTILIDNGAQERGLQLLLAAATALPDDPSVQYHLALAYQNQGETKRAQELLKGILGSGKDFAERPEAQVLLDSMGNQ